MEKQRSKFLFEMMSELLHNKDEPPALITAEDSSLDDSDVQSNDQTSRYQQTSCDCTTTSSIPEEKNIRHRQDQICDACDYCDDLCGNPDCNDCTEKINAKSLNSSIPRTRSKLGLLGFEFDFCRVEQKTYTMCQIKRHANKDSAWLVVGNAVYDVTTYIDIHPGGERSILKKSGGVVDCAKDMRFHSDKAKKLWKRHFIGTIKQCPCHSSCKP